MELENNNLEEEQSFERDVFTRQDYRLVKFILGNDEISDDVKKHVNMFWAFKDKEMALTNLEDIDVKRQMMLFRDAELDYFMSKPQYKNRFEDQVMLTNFRALLFAKLKRSTGGVQRERFILGSQIQQRLGETEEVPSGGILHRVGRALGLGGRG